MNYTAFVFVVVFGLLTQASTGSYTASGRAKAFKGPEGETITMIPLDNNEKMLVLAHNTYGPFAEKAFVFKFQNDNINPQVVIPNPHAKDEKDHSGILVLNREGDQWVYTDFLQTDLKKIQRIKLTYSEDLSQKINTAQILKKAQDFKSE